MKNNCSIKCLRLVILLFAVINLTSYTHLIYAQENIVWQEQFNDLAPGTYVDTGVTAWSTIPTLNNTSKSYGKVIGNRYEIRNSGVEVAWKTEKISIINNNNVSVSVRLFSGGNFEGSDYLNVYYSIDDGPEIPLDDGLQTGIFPTTTATASNLSGNYIQVIARIFNNNSNERYRIDDITVSGAATELLEIEAFGGNLNCNNPTITLNVNSNIAEVNYSWTGPNGFSSTLQSPAVSNAGVYLVNVTTTDGTQSASDQVSVTTDTIKPMIIIEADTMLTCSRTSILLNASTSVPDVNYLWSGPNAYTSTQQNPVTSIPGDYWVKVTNPINGCMSVDTITVQQNNSAPAEVKATVEGTLSCSQNTVTLHGLSSSINVSYSWSGPNGYSSSEQNPVASNPGFYSLLLTDTINRCTSSASVEVAQNRALPKNVAATVSGVITCATPTVTLTGASGTVDAIYSWSDPNGNVYNTKTLDVSVPGIYSFKVKDVMSGCIDSVNVAVEQDIQIPLGLTASVSDTLSCSITSVVLSASVTTVGAIYSWKGPHNFNSNEQNVVANIPGNYSIEVIDPKNGCKAEAQVTVVEEECQ